MSYQRDREEFVAAVVEEGLPLKKARLVLRNAATVQRLAVKECNEELTASDRRRDQLAQARIRALVEPHGIKPRFGGDPRGYCVKLLLPKTKKWNTWGGAEEGYGVPTRDR